MYGGRSAAIKLTLAGEKEAKHKGQDGTQTAGHGQSLMSPLYPEGSDTGLDNPEKRAEISQKRSLVVTVSGKCDYEGAKVKAKWYHIYKGDRRNVLCQISSVGNQGQSAHGTEQDPPGKMRY